MGILNFIGKIMNNVRIHHNNNRPSGGNYKQGNFIPTNKDKCINIAMNKPIYYRSSYEERFFNWCDQNKNVVRWGSEVIEVPYLFDVDNKLHRYYPDAYVELIDKDGARKILLIEIKPEKGLDKPKQPRNKTRKAMENYSQRVNEFVKNQNKWKYARMFCEGKNWEFKILTETQLF
jgi:hypothetical protein